MTTGKNGRMSLPFSVFTRYQALSDSIGLLRKNNESFKILEVGGRGNYLSNFLPNDTITILDVIDSDEPNYVKGDGRKLSFKKGDFDLVVSTDVLEHIPPDGRRKYIEEQIRVAKRAVILAGPIYSKYIEKCETAANDYYKKVMNIDHPWLGEHLNYVLPSKELVENTINENGLPWSVWHNQQLELWRELLIVDIAVAAVGTPKVLVAFNKLNNIYNNTVYPFDRGKNGYRSIYIIATDGSKPPTIASSPVFTDLDNKHLLKLLATITELDRAIGDHYQLMYQREKNHEKMARELSAEVKRLTVVNTEIITRYQELDKRIKRIESSAAYKAWRVLKKAISR